MLFSNPDISRFVRENYVAAWESVRPVPTVEIDFGNGTKIKRTVNGNIATYISEPTGRVLDIIPGLNSTEAYLADLRNALNLYRAAFARGADFDRVVRNYHAANIAEPMRYVAEAALDVSKAAVERRIRYTLVKASDAHGFRGIPGWEAAPSDPGKRLVERTVRALTAEEQTLLAADTEVNRKERKPLLHRILAEKVARPAEITKRVYKEVLHCDLDDPYLGLVTKAFNGGGYEDR